jgi:hypothetical protein
MMDRLPVFFGATARHNLPSDSETRKSAREPTMNKPSERIVVFVTPAQKRAIASTAEGLGISVSELMRRAVLSFGATSEQVKAASIVDRLRAPREPDALNEALRKVARGTRHARGTATPALPAGLVRTPSPLLPAGAGETGALHPLPLHDAAAPHAELTAPQEDLPEESPPFDPATASEEEMRNAAEAVARVAAAKAAALATHPDASHDALRATGLDMLRPRPRIDVTDDSDDAPHADPAQKDGRFA